jgi:hypothetical protein
MEEVPAGGQAESVRLQLLIGYSSERVTHIRYPIRFLAGEHFIFDNLDFPTARSSQCGFSQGSGTPLATRMKLTSPTTQRIRPCRNCPGRI